MQGQAPSVDSHTQSTNREWTCQRWFHNIAARVSAKTHRYVGRFVAVASAPFTFIPSLACDLYYGTKNLHQRTVSEAPVEGQHLVHPDHDINNIEELRKENCELHGLISRYERAMLGTEDRVQILKRENDIHLFNLSRAERHTSDLEKHLETEKALNQHLTSKVQALNETVERLNRKVGRLTRENEKLVRETENLARENLESDYTISDLKRALHGLQDSSSSESDSHDLGFMEDGNESIGSNASDEPENTSNSGIQDGDTGSLNGSFKSVSSSDLNAV